jgi:aerobic-type carbon monoxide dehydrogenase small subunit (CoxS/CutS family)
VITVRTLINEQPVALPVEDRKLLVHFLREDVGLTGTHVGCMSGRCGCCTVVLDGEPVKSCMVLAAQTEGRTVLTVEGLAGCTREGPVIQRAFRECDAVECGFCTSGMLMIIYATLSGPSEDQPAEMGEALTGNLCRCTGYKNIIRAAEQAKHELSAPDGAESSSEQVQGR